MRRIHRTLIERLSYLAIYECKDCHAEDNLPRNHTLHLGKSARCPKCGTYRIVKLKEPDHIDPMHTGPLNLLERLVGGKLFHCRYCRIQFFDRRRLHSEVAADEASAAAEAVEAKNAERTETASPGTDGPDA
jgi:DNA-directed RNA polymerase subunit RPC12/RpoP